RKTQHRAVRQHILARHFPTEIDFHHCRQLSPTRTNRPEVLSLSSNERGRGREGDVRDRIVDITPENISTNKQSLERIETDSSLAARQSLRTQIGVRVCHHIPHAKVAVQLV